MHVGEFTDGRVVTAWLSLNSKWCHESYNSRIVDSLLHDINYGVIFIAQQLRPMIPVLM